MTDVISIKQAPPGWKTNDQFVYIGRGSFWGNQYRIGAVYPDTAGNPATRDQVCEMFEKYQLPKMIESGAVLTLKGKTLVCFCHPERCHGHTLAKAAGEV